jgi:tRNA (cmo5U34)-methyltransferase
MTTESAGSRFQTTPPDPPASSLGHNPATERWEFDQSVTDVFDDMLDRSIPDYRQMRALVFDLAAPFVTPDSTIADLGTSRGEAFVPFLNRFGAANRYVGLEISEPMVAAAKLRFATYPGDLVRIEKSDLRTDRFPFVDASVVLSILTLMFVPINYRIPIVARIYDSLNAGGAFVLVEKVLPDGAALDPVFVDRYHRLKRDNGYTTDEIERKRFALEGVQVPITARMNEQLLRDAGFRAVDCFWRWVNFAGWIAIK